MLQVSRLAFFLSFDGVSGARRGGIQNLLLSDLFSPTPGGGKSVLHNGSCAEMFKGNLKAKRVDRVRRFRPSAKLDPRT